MSIKYTKRLAEADLEPSVGSADDSDDNALTETINGLYKVEVIHAGAHGAHAKPLIRHTGVGGLVHQQTVARTHRQYPTSRGRAALLCHTGRVGHGGST